MSASSQISQQTISMLTRKWILSDSLSSTHAQCLKATLYSYFNVQKQLPSTLPPGYHLIYFNPKTEEEALSKDGYDTHQQPDDSGFKRRMWIGGEMNFHSPIAFGQKSLCVETIDKFRNLKNNHYVTINREIITGDSLALQETRSLIYTNELYTPQPMSTVKKQAKYSHEMTPTQLLLFRYSALTFNSHKIHYDKQYAQSEGYPTIIMQGPLSVTLLLEWVGTLYDGLKIKSFKYKNCAPIFVNEKIKLCLQDNQDSIDVWIQKMDGSLLMDGCLVVE